MPLVSLQTNRPITEEQSNELLAGISKAAAQAIGKPEAYVMVILQHSPAMMAGTKQDCAFVEVRSIGGLTAEVNKQLSASLGQLLQRSLSLEPRRIYMNFVDIPAEQWGWNLTTFG
jgi:phenylpyruvate tautomerase